MYFDVEYGEKGGNGHLRENVSKHSVCMATVLALFLRLANEELSYLYVIPQTNS